jgi:hypothetical protein
MSSIISTIVHGSRSGGSAVIAVAFLKYSSSVTVRRVEKRNSIAPIVEWTVRDPLAISLSLRQYDLWPERQLLGFDNADNLAIHAQGVVGGAISGFKFLYRKPVWGA